MGKALAAVLRVLTGILHRRLRPRHPGLAQLWADEGVWKADAEDIREIATPAARIIARRVKVPAEAADAVAVMFGTAGYVEKNLDKDGQIRDQAAVVDLNPAEYSHHDEETPQ